MPECRFEYEDSVLKMLYYSIYLSFGIFLKYFFWYESRSFCSADFYPLQGRHLDQLVKISTDLMTEWAPVSVIPGINIMATYVKSVNK